MSTTEQRKLIGCLRAKLSLDDEVYKEMLSEYNVTSSKDLTNATAELFIRKLKNNAISMGVWQPTKRYGFQKYKYNTETTVKGMATAKQKRKIEAMWLEVSIQENEDARQTALKKFIKRITNKDHMSFLTSKDISALINAILHMNKKEKHYDNT